MGKWFDILLKGTEIQGNGGKPNWIKAEFMRFAPTNSGKLTFNAEKHIKKLAPNTESNTNTENKSNTPVNW